MVLIYLGQRLWVLVSNFFYHWYVHGSRNIGHYFISFLERVDQSLAIRITLRHFFEPLYKDYTVIGRILGVFFRSGRILIGTVVYVFLGVLALGIFLAWLILPVLLIFQTIKNF